MSRQIVVTYQIELPDDFDKSVAIGMAYQVIHRELGEKLLKEFGVLLAPPKFADGVTPPYTGKPRGRRPGTPKLVVGLKAHGTNGHDGPPDIAA